MGLSGCSGADDKRDPETERLARDVLARVAPHQIHDLVEGEYPRTAWEAVQGRRAPQGIVWAYPWGVTLYGLLRTSEVTGERSYADFVVRHNEIVGREHDYLRFVQSAFGPAHTTDVARLVNASTIARLLALGSLDNTGAMGSQMLEGFLRHSATPTAEQTELLRIVANYITLTQSRLGDGTFWRPERDQTLWIDDLFMSCPFLVRHAERSGDARHLDDAARQVIGMALRQQDADGLWYHGNYIAQGKTSPYKWGRGNGWAMVSTVEVLSAMRSDHPNRAALLEILSRHIEGVIPLQASSGRWRQVLDHPELWEETSCSAMFAYSIARAVRRGWIEPERLAVARRALRGIAQNVTATGVVNGTCEGTSIGLDLSYYVNRQRPEDDWHGPGPVLLAASELLAAEGERPQ
jgi:unsaturated rhamnogalacturonyl hydrolase